MAKQFRLVGNAGTGHLVTEGRSKENADGQVYVVPVDSSRAFYGENTPYAYPQAKDLPWLKGARDTQNSLAKRVLSLGHEPSGRDWRIEVRDSPGDQWVLLA